MKDTFYFSHDYNTRSDDKMKSLIRKHGVIGYGIFWCIIEDLYNNANALRTDYDGIAYDLRVGVDTVKSVINDFDLFVFDDDIFGSLSVERRLNERSLKSAKARESALSRWNKKQEDANAVRTQCDSNAIKERKGKEIKEKKEINQHFDVYIFDEFWDIYDKKISKDKCLKKFNALSNNDKLKIKETIKDYVASTPDVKFRKNPETYLNNKSWNDEIIQKQNGVKKINKLDEFQNNQPSINF